MPPRSRERLLPELHRRRIKAMTGSETTFLSAAIAAWIRRASCKARNPKFGDASANAFAACESFSNLCNLCPFHHQLQPVTLKRHRCRHFIEDMLRTRRRIRLVGDERLPDAWRQKAIILTGHQNRRLDDLGVCQEGEANGKPFYGIFLDDPHPKEVDAVNRPLGHYLRKTCTKRFMKRIWDARATCHKPTSTPTCIPIPSPLPSSPWQPPSKTSASWTRCSNAITELALSFAVCNPASAASATNSTGWGTWQGTLRTS